MHENIANNVSNKYIIIKVCPEIHYTSPKTVSNSFTTVFNPTNNISLERQWEALHLDLNCFTKKWKMKKKNEEEKNGILNGRLSI